MDLTNDELRILVYTMWDAPALFDSAEELSRDPDYPPLLEKGLVHVCKVGPYLAVRITEGGEQAVKDEPLFRVVDACMDGGLFYKVEEFVKQLPMEQLPEFLTRGYGYTQFFAIERAKELNAL